MLIATFSQGLPWLLCGLGGIALSVWAGNAIGHVAERSDQAAVKVLCVLGIVATVCGGLAAVLWSLFSLVVMKCPSTGCFD
jgi:F0F1-type ATP synthase membrane subunit c/vacuolar-type H+-ATPase subunit K